MPDKPSVLAESITAALQHLKEQQAAGATRAEQLQNLEKTLRAAWPQRRTEAWHYLCDQCQDTGWRPHDCPETPCGRTKPHSPHSFVMTCLCAKGGAVRASLTSRQRPDPTEEAGTGRRKPMRFGR